MTRAKDHSAGFTLLEVLVGLALLSILSIVLTTALRTGIGLWERNDAHLGGAELAAAFRTLQSNLERALPIPECFDPSQPCTVTFDGGSADARFVVANPGRVGRLGDAIMRLSVERGDDGPYLALAWNTYDPMLGIGGEGFAETLVLLDGVTEISFDYFGEEPAEPFARSWHREWRTRTTLPAAVRINLRMEDLPDQAWSIKLLNGR